MLRALTEKRMFSALSQRDYRLLWTGNISSHIGQWVQQVGKGWLVLTLTNSPFQLGLVAFFRGIPMLLFAPLGGALADRVPRRTLLIIAQMSEMVIAFTLFILIATDLIQMWHIYLLSVLAGAGMALNQPTRQALVYDLAGKQHLTNAVALNSLGMNVTRVLGPTLGGVLITLIGVEGCFLVQAIGFALGSVMAVMIKGGSQPQGHGTSLWKGILEGGRYVWADKKVFALLLIGAVPAVFGMPYMQLMPVFARDVLHRGPTEYGLLMTAVGVGALASALVIVGLGDFKGKGRLQIIAIFGFGIMLASFSQSSWFPLSLFLVAAAGAANSVAMVMNNTLLQTAVPDQVRGRVFSFHTLTFGLMPIGSLPAGMLADAQGAPFAVLILGGLVAASSLAIGILYRQIRTL